MIAVGALEAGSLASSRDVMGSEKKVGVSESPVSSGTKAMSSSRIYIIHACLENSRSYHQGSELRKGYKERVGST